MAKTEKEIRPHLSLEILAVLGVIAGLFLVLCLVSFSPPDPSGEISNWGGMMRLKLGFSAPVSLVR